MSDSEVDVPEREAENTSVRDAVASHRGGQPDEESSGVAAGETAGTRPPAVEVRGLHKRFNADGDSPVVAVDGVSFSIERGSVVGLLGPNGAGKTTTIKSILGMVVPDDGTVNIHGTDVMASPREAYDHVDAMLEGARNDYWRLTIRENLRYFATINGTDPDGVADRHDRLLERLDLADRADEPVRSLSRGMKQKVSLASVLATDSDVLFLDEPTLGLDVESSIALREELRRIVAERNLTVVLSSHDMRVIEDVCDRVLVMNNGRVVADGSVPALLSTARASGYRIASEDLTERHCAALRDRFDVATVDQQGPRTVVEVTTDSDGFYRLTDHLEAHDITLGTVETVEPTLEDVFLSLTERERDGR